MYLTCLFLSLGVALGYQSCTLFGGDPEERLHVIVPPPAHHAAEQAVPLFVGVMTATKFLRLALFSL